MGSEMCIRDRQCTMDEIQQALERNKERRAAVGEETTQWLLINNKLKLVSKGVDRIVCSYIATHISENTGNTGDQEIQRPEKKRKSDRRQTNSTSL